MDDDFDPVELERIRRFGRPDWRRFVRPDWEATSAGSCCGSPIIPT